MLIKHNVQTGNKRKGISRMRQGKIIRKKDGQSILDYTMTIAIATLIFFAMGTYIKRGVQGMVKTVADQLGEQRNSDQVRNVQLKQGYLIASYINTLYLSNRDSVERIGEFTYIPSEVTDTRTNALINLGFTERIIR